MKPRSHLALRAVCLGALILWSASACQPAALPSPTTTAGPTDAAQVLPTTIIPPTATLTITPAASSTPRATNPAYTTLCSPLEGERLDDLANPDLLKNPFQPPRPGDDGGHFGVDFAYWTRADGSSMLGLPIYSALDGVVAAVIDNRQPYGNAIIVETKLDRIDPGRLSALPVQAYDPTRPLQPATSLTCPAYDFTPSGESLSLYLLYAHMRQPANFEAGNRVTCGEQIGQVGTTGNSVNEHLHFETRIGPSGMRFTSMAHYDTSATQEEMRNYCLWRLSGAFMAFDPMDLLKSKTVP